MVNVFLAPGLFRNIRRSIVEGVKAEELSVSDGDLAELISEHYRGELVGFGH